MRLINLTGRELAVLRSIAAAGGTIQRPETPGTASLCSLLTGYGFLVELDGTCSLTALGAQNIQRTQGVRRGWSAHVPALDFPVNGFPGSRIRPSKIGVEG